MANAVQDFLWEELNIQAQADSRLDSSLSVKQIMDSWTLKKGYPVVHVSRLEASNNQSYYNSLRVTQKWFLLNPLNKAQYKSNYTSVRWYVPFTFTTKDELVFDFESKPYWLKPNENERKSLKYKNYYS
jgi:aminopeptidase N